MEALKAASDVTPALNQVEWHPRNYDPELHKYCKDNKILLQAYSSLGTSKDSSLRNDGNVKKIAIELGNSPSQVLLRWALQNNIAIIPKASSKNHLVENISLDFDIPADKMKILDNFEQREQSKRSPNNVA